MPYATDYSHPKKDDVLWGNDAHLPDDKKFDTANPAEDLPCNFGDTKHQERSVAYRFDPELGWLLCCYEHASEVLDSDGKPFKPGPVGERIERGLDEVRHGKSIPAERATTERRKNFIPQNAACDSPHDELDDAPPATVAFFPTKSKAQFYCAPCALRELAAKIVSPEGFEALEIMSVR